MEFTKTKSKLEELLKSKPKRRKLIQELQGRNRYKNVKNNTSAQDDPDRRSSSGLETFPKLRDVLVNDSCGEPLTRDRFQAFLDNRHSTESLNFFMAVERFRAKFSESLEVSARTGTGSGNNSESPTQRKSGNISRRLIPAFPPVDEEREGPLEFALNIAERFVRPGSPEQINISQSLRDQVLADIENAKASSTSPSLDIFAAAQQEVYKMMSHNDFPKFRAEAIKQTLNGLRFLSELQDLREDQDPQRRLAMSRNLISRYMQVGSAFELQFLEPKLREKIARIRKPTQATFSGVQRRVLKQLSTNVVLNAYMDRIN